MPAEMHASAAPDAAVPALNLTPMRKTEIDLFARAPQVKKMSRRDKQRAALQERAAAEKAKSGPGAPHREDNFSSPSSKTTSSAADDIFATVFTNEADAAEEKLKRDRESGRKKNKRTVLRHALHRDEEEDERTAFVGNLPNTIDKKDVAKAFKDCGAIESVRVRSQALASDPSSSGGGSSGNGAGKGEDGPAAAKVPRKDIGRAVRVLRGDIKKDPQYSATAYVLFKEPASVAVAIEKKNGVVFKGRHLVVTGLGTASAAYPPETSIFLGNIAYNTTEEDVWAYFAGKGITDVKRVRLVRDRESGDCKGFGYVEFHSKASVEPAIATRGNVLNGRELRIVHVNKSKDVKAVTASRREKRGRSLEGGKDARGGASVGAGAAGEKRARIPGREQPAWMGVTTNPRRKIPRDLRPLVETNAERKFKGPRPIVKRKMRNPEKQ